MTGTKSPTKAVLTFLVVAVIAVLAALFTGGSKLRETAFDWMLGTTTVPPAGDIRVVAIDSKSLTALGPWPWPRTRMADLIARIGADRPRVIVLDILLSGPGRTDAGVDANAALGSAIASSPVVLAALLNDVPVETAPTPPPPVLFAGPPAALRPWSARGALWPFEPFAKQAAGIGIGSLAGDSVGTVRDVPLFVTVGNDIYPGLAAETVRVAEGAAGYILTGRSQLTQTAARLEIGSISLGLPSEGTLRFRPSGPEDWAGRTVSAGDILAGAVGPGTFDGAIVLVGGTAPELGTLRPTAANPVTPGVQITADAVTAMMAGTVPLRPDTAPVVEAAARSLMAILGVFLGWRLPPGRSLGTAGIAAGLWVVGCLAVLHGASLLVDPASPLIAVMSATVISATTSAIVARRRAAAVVAQFRQRLAPEIVDRIVSKPGVSRVEGERRTVTFLFTDLEGFTAMALAQRPEDVVALLQDYFQGVSAIITAAGGTIDKYVGDAVNAMFNAPNDLADHAVRAIEAAQQIQIFTEEFRMRPIPHSLGLGRTRIGIETGEVIVGDVGGDTRRDYTAYGTAINTAARLEALNARLGTTICVGPAARALAPSLRFVSRGVHDLKGIGSLEVFEPAED